MSEFLDFSGFETGNLLAWTTAGTPTIESYGATGDHAVRLNASGESISKTFSGNSYMDTATVGCNIEPHATGVLDMTVLHAGNTWLVKLEYDIDHWDLHLYEASVDRVETELLLDLYETVNIALVLKPTGGTVFMDGDAVLDWDKDTTNTDGITSIEWDCSTAGNFLVDDVYAVKSGFPGILKMPALRPAVDNIDVLEMSVTGATEHADAVNVHPSDGDTSYVSTSAGVEEDWFTSSLVTDQLNNETPTKVLGLKVTAVSKLVSASPTMRLGIVTKGNDVTTPDFSDTKNLTASYDEYSYIWDANPEDSKVWLAGEFIPSAGPTVGVEHNGDARTTQVAGEAAIIVGGRSDLYKGSGGFDLHFRVPAMSSGNSVTIQTNASIYTNFKGGSTVKIGTSSSLIYCSIGGIGTGSKPTPVAQKIFRSTVTGGSPTDVRVIYHDKFISVYLNGWWFFTTGFDSMEYEDELSIKLYSTGWSPTITNVINRELGDWREAVFVDMETPSSSALTAVIQDRPVLYWPNPDGSMRFTYGDSAGGPISLSNNILRKHSRIKSNDSRAAADVIIRGAGDSMMHDTVYATTKGFQTRVYNLGSLDSGAVEAARRLLIRARENAIRHQLTIRPDLRIVIGDELGVSYTSVGGRSESYDMVVESVSVTVNYGKGTMTIQGREI